MPNNRQRYEKPYRLRALEFERDDEPMDDFEKAFLTEFNEKMFPASLDQVRQENYRECLRNTITTDLLPPTNVEISSSKSLVYERVYLLPEEVRTNSRLMSFFRSFDRQSFFNMLLVV